MKFDKTNFEYEVLKSDMPVLVDFYADWCMPCKMMAPIVEALADEYEGKVKIGKLNVDENMELASQYGVMTIPTFILFKDGKVVKNKSGVLGQDDLIDFILE